MFIALIHKLAGKSHRPGVFQCDVFGQPFTITVGSVMKRSEIPHLMAP